MSTFDTLPVILVSAVNETAATGIISDLVDNDVTNEFLKESQSLDRVWKLVNKYYTVNVRVHVLTDNGRLEVNPDDIEAHVIYVTEEEVADGGGVARAEARAAAGLWRRAAVRLLLAPGPAPALRAWAARQRAERAAPHPPGLRRARAALHAHTWRGLQRTDRAALPSPAHRAAHRPRRAPSARDIGGLRVVRRVGALGRVGLGGGGAARRGPGRGLRRGARRAGPRARSPRRAGRRGRAGGPGRAPAAAARARGGPGAGLLPRAGAGPGGLLTRHATPGARGPARAPAAATSCSPRSYLNRKLVQHLL